MKGSAGLLEKEVILRVPLHPDELDTVRLTLYGVAVRMGFTYESIEDLKVAVTEACNHILVQHGHNAIGAACLQLVFTIRPQELVVHIDSEGLAVSFGEQTDWKGPAEGDADSLNALESAPLGLYLMQALVDEVTLVPAEGEGSDRIVLVKQLEQNS
ncbi:MULTISPECIES: ATP-binding protein [unclassified Paenibacillus]|uniref:ATP-binding protein n=1 Tax=unclassified Paenibacillus TaxID=185978 RepID=UPI001AE7B915|nr:MULTISPECIES: ATP-binding protein [unclassified Paenibacillus]MBP1153901.1 serine/threonine-protein kinase RsbW [Paenibacillus sp. PvP091]MBP1170714.1 serine/threonine-protein kinase RsbW [Paenibacillus sp. PvR098]MBP2441742.1 serine/threonine-protein kinase RsbW [Paenibacillus sp. PvP052]